MYAHSDGRGRNAEMDQISLRNRLFSKIHGVLKNEERPTEDTRETWWRLVATLIAGRRSFFQPFREKVRTMLREKPAIFIGISGQDFNLQAECATATAGGVAYPLNHPE